MIAAPAMVHARMAAMAFAGMGLLACGSCASTQAEPAMAPPSRSAEDCMFSVVVKEWAAIDEQRFIIYGLTKHEPYLGKLFFPTPDLVNNIGMAVIDADRNGRICGQSSDYVEFRDATIPGRNLITSLRRISDEEAKALLEQAKPKPKEKSTEDKDQKSDKDAKAAEPVQPQ
jgi:hypothetical protein